MLFMLRGVRWGRLLAQSGPWTPPFLGVALSNHVPALRCLGSSAIQDNAVILKRRF